MSVKSKKGISQFIVLVRNEIVKLFATKSIYIIFILSLLGVIALAMNIDSQPEEIATSKVELEREIEEYREILSGDYGMTVGLREKYIGLLKADEYMLENNIKPIKTHSIGNLVLSLNKIFALVVVIMIIGAGKVFSDEYTNQTLPSLVSRPCSRIKIFISKILSLLLYCLFILLLVHIITIVVGGYFWGFDGINDLIVGYEREIVVRTVLEQSLYYSFFNLFTLLACAIITVLMSLIFRNGIIAISTSILLYIIGSSLVLSMYNYPIMKYSLLANIQFQIYFDGVQVFKGMNKWFSVGNILLHIFVVLVFSMMIFCRRNADE